MRGLWLAEGSGSPAGGMAGVGEEFWPREEELVMLSYPGLRGARKEASSLASYE